MAMTITWRNKAMLTPGLVMDIYDYSAVNADTGTVSVSGGYITSVKVCDANHNILTSHTCGAWTTSGNVSNSTLTAGSTVTGGTLEVIHGGE